VTNVIFPATFVIGAFRHLDAPPKCILKVTVHRPSTARRLTMAQITPCLWFDGKAEEAANFYITVFPKSHVDSIHHAPRDYPSGKAGDVLTVEFTLMGQPFVGLNGGPQFRFTEAISFQIPVENQAQVDRYSNALSAVPEAEQCGWVKDRFGVSWQIVPGQLTRLLSEGDRSVRHVRSRQ
jgi:predicted 3-demethylubiquinone-9 3-methyltransferase (glyoxalase superfamily)